jgi:hypothetical protein
VVIWNPAVVMAVGVSRLGEAAQIRLGLHREHLGDRSRVVGEIAAVAGADLQDPAGASVWVAELPPGGYPAVNSICQVSI